jgi:HSP20 family protein
MPFRMWDPFRGFDRDFEALRREIESVFENAMEGKRPFARFAFLPGAAARAYPLMNVAEDSDNVYVEALAPGLNPDTLEVSVLDNTLRVAGEKPPISEDVKPEAFHRSERSAGRFVRTMALPVGVDAGKVQAEYKNGLLLLTLPKAEEAKPKKIAVSVS